MLFLQQEGVQILQQCWGVVLKLVYFRHFKFQSVIISGFVFMVHCNIHVSVMQMLLKYRFTCTTAERVTMATLFEIFIMMRVGGGAAISGSLINGGLTV